MKYTLVIPANLNSKRLKKKLLIRIGTKSIIQHVLLKIQKFKIFKHVYILSDSELIKKELHKFKIIFLKNKKKHLNATSRLFEFLKNIKGDNIILLFADELFIQKKYLNHFIKKTEKYKKDHLFQAVTKFENSKQLMNISNVKCLLDEQNYVIDFKRQINPNNKKIKFKKSIGLFLFKKKYFLRKKIINHPNYDKISVEQLNLIHSGFKLRSIEINYKFPSINTPKDLNFAKKYYKIKNYREYIK